MEIPLLRRLSVKSLGLALMVLSSAASLVAQPGQPSPVSIPLKEAGFDQKLGAQLPLDVAFRDEDGRTVQLRKYFGQKPVIVSFAYYSCPMLCPMTLDGLTKALRGVSLNVGQQFEMVNISINPQEQPALARQKKDSYLAQYGRPGASAGWHFLTGDEPSIRKVADAAGYRYTFDATSKQYVHASGVLVATPGGKTSRYFYGIEFSPLDLRLGLVEASAGKIGSAVDVVLLYCCKYDVLTGKYSVLISRVVQLAGIATVLSIGFLFLVLSRLQRRRMSTVAESR